MSLFDDWLKEHSRYPPHWRLTSPEDYESAVPTEDNYSIKVVLLGDYGVGKTSVMRRFLDGTFYEPPHFCSIAPDFLSKRVEIDEKKIKLQIGDTSGMERFRCISRNYYHGTQGFLLLYNVAEKKSFEAVKLWLSDIDKNVDDINNVNRILIGNKSDLEERRVVDFSDGKELADSLGIPFLETSAKDDINIEQAFVMLAAIIKQRLEKTEHISESTTASAQTTTKCYS